MGAMRRRRHLLMGREVLTWSARAAELAVEAYGANACTRVATWHGRRHAQRAVVGSRCMRRLEGGGLVMSLARMHRLEGGGLVMHRLKPGGAPAEDMAVGGESEAVVVAGGDLTDRRVEGHLYGEGEGEGEGEGWG